jgi:hypothetical protein
LTSLLPRRVNHPDKAQEDEVMLHRLVEFGLLCWVRNRSESDTQRAKRLSGQVIVRRKNLGASQISERTRFAPD